MLPALVSSAIAIGAIACSRSTPAPPAPTPAVACAPQGPTPADPLASDAAKAVLQYLWRLPNRSDKRVVSGQMRRFDQWDWSPILGYGVTPGLVGIGWVCDDGGKTAPCNGKPFLASGLLQKAADHYHQGGLVQVDEGIGNPLMQTGAGDTRFSPADFDRLLTPGDPVNASFLAQLDVIAAGYEFLQEQGVVALVHGLPEMNGTWYWWSKGTPDQFKALYRLEFDYLTKSKGLHNLLFTYAPNAGNGAYGDFYPGDAYVDIVGVDYYLDVDGAIPKAGGYDELTTQVAPCKPFAFVEFGPLPGGVDVFRPRNYDQLIVAIKQTMPRVTYWHSWKSVWGMGIADYDGGATHLNVPELLHDPWVVNLGDVALPADASSP